MTGSPKGRVNLRRFFFCLGRVCSVGSLNWCSWNRRGQ